MLRNLLEKTPRYALLVLGFWLPRDRKRRAERWLRGYEQCSKLRRSDAVIVSYGKSGRTWVRVLISRFYQLHCGLRSERLLGFDNLHGKDRRIPRIFLTHDNYIQDYSGNRDSKRDFYDKRVILLVRSPQDVAVSQYFQWKFRMRARKKALNEYPDHGTDISLYDFAMSPAGLPKIIDFMNLWADERERIRDLLIVRYEDLRADTAGVFAKIVRFLGAPEDTAAIRGAVEYASVENMRKLEEKRVFWLAGGRMTARDSSNPDSFKVRRAKVGGYRDYFEDEEVARIDAMVRAKLSPVYGYGEPKASAPNAPAGRSGGMS
jgi:Sulfotransferase domain